MRWGACCLGIRPLYSLLIRNLPLKIWKLFSWDGELVVLGSDPYTLFWLATFLLRFERCSLQIRNLAFSDQESDLFRSRNWRLQVRNLSKYQTLPIFRSGTLPLLITEMLIPKQETFLLRSGNFPPYVDQETVLLSDRSYPLEVRNKTSLISGTCSPMIVRICSFVIFWYQEPILWRTITFPSNS